MDEIINNYYNFNQNSDLVFLGRSISRLTRYSLRNESNLLDVYSAFKELGIDYAELMTFRLKCIANEISFPYSLPSFQIHSSEPPLVERLSQTNTIHSFLYPNASIIAHHFIGQNMMDKKGNRNNNNNNSSSETIMEPHWQSRNPGISLIHPHPPHIPPFLPAFPPIHTYEQTAV